MQSLKPKGRYFRGPVTGDRSHSPPDASMKPLRGYSDNEHREFTQRSPVTGHRTPDFCRALSTDSGHRKKHRCRRATITLASSYQDTLICY